jgi:hypothetical protein
MRKVVTVLSAIGASFALASAASAATMMSIVGSNMPGENVYSLVISYDASDQVQGYGMGVVTTGTYTGAFTRTAPAPFNTNAGNVIVVGGQTGAVHTWAAVSGGVNGPGGTFTVGTITISAAAGQDIQVDVLPAEGFLLLTTGGFSSTFAPDSIGAAITIIPEPTTAALLGLGIVGLALSGRKNRA